MGPFFTVFEDSEPSRPPAMEDAVNFLMNPWLSALQAFRRAGYTEAVRHKYKTEKEFATRIDRWAASD
eukprot:CAMPEP_0204524272 /NCGR_PEP_ID=MMETSP0661-20131031/7291_1 /ASSEMBLY_ACC=CAM_ASM_000606 /TAXON_ID=109239 /ORGANISM="Alexandrium margalefi, Strain AMGDE01CS-322" /LENGTH=67 /DNA_ID=CAMNT_0051530019 /DNA_START=46 /DNA_END=250 /DNA_ORIENTATION=+